MLRQKYHFKSGGEQRSWSEPAQLRYSGGKSV